jgi:hypothetical protein
MRFDGCFLGSGYASVLVPVGLQKLRLPWTSNLRGWESCGEASRGMENKKGQLTVTAFVLFFWGYLLVCSKDI